MGKKTKEAQSRLCFTVLTVFIVFAVAFVGYFVCTGLNHDCTGEDCPVCLELRIARSLFEGLFLAVFLAGFAAAGTSGAVRIPPLYYANPLTPVSLKTRYNS